MALQPELEVPFLEAGSGIFEWRPRAAVPYLDHASAILAGRDAAFAATVFQRMIFDMHGKPLRFSMETRAFRHGPTDQHALPFEAEVVVQMTGVVTLDDEAQRLRAARCLAM